MPLKDISLAGLQKNEWTKIRLDIDKPDWQKAMSGLFQIVVLFDSDKELNGTIYFDNLGVIEKSERIN